MGPPLLFITKWTIPPLPASLVAFCHYTTDFPYHLPYQCIAYRIESPCISQHSRWFPDWKFSLICISQTSSNCKPFLGEVVFVIYTVYRKPLFFRHFYSSRPSPTFESSVLNFSGPSWSSSIYSLYSHFRILSLWPKLSTCPIPSFPSSQIHSHRRRPTKKKQVEYSIYCTYTCIQFVFTVSLCYFLNPLPIHHVSSSPLNITDS